MKRCSVSFFIGEMQIKILTKMAVIPLMAIPNAGENAKQ